ncbi:MAG: response regulator transcription factor [Saprospiraceae bacterium]
MTHVVQIVLVDDDQLVLDRLRSLIISMENVSLAAAYNNPRQALTALSTLPVDLVIAGYLMPPVHGVDLTRQIKATHPDLPVILMNESDQADAVLEGYHAGASGYLSKMADRRELEIAICLVAEGRMYFNQGVLKSLLSKTTSLSPERGKDKKVDLLTKRETEIIRLIAQELSSAEIAEKLFISAGTVETHRHNIMRKLKVRNVIGVVKFAIKNGLI